MRLTIAVLFILIGSCSVVDKENNRSTFLQHAKDVKEIGGWKLNANIYVVPVVGKKIAVDIRWSKKGAKSKIYVVDFLGIVHARCVIDFLNPTKNFISVGDKKITGKQEINKTIARLMSGSNIEIENIYYWIQAIPDPTTKHKVVLNKEKKLISIEQNGAVIRYLSFSPLILKGEDIHQEKPKTVFMPRKISIFSKQGKMIINVNYRKGYINL
jgi:outer membrane biogenesis lipoprotein LolB